MNRYLRFRRPWLLATASLVLGGCEFGEVSITEPEDLVVAEIYLKVGHGADEISAFLHWTMGSGPTVDLAGAKVTLRAEGGVPLLLTLDEPAGCLSPETLSKVEGACFTARSGEDDFFRPADRVTATIELSDGRSLQGVTTVPSAFALREPDAEAECMIAPSTPLEMVWGASAGAWAYVVEASIRGLREALEPQGISVDDDPLVLSGYAISSTDTTLVFPRDFGLTERFDMDRDLALALQEGLPPGTSAEITLAAMDRNFANWVRGGGFNPSGPVRIPSLRGDGTGVVGSVVRRSIHVVVGGQDSALRGCGDAS